MSFSASTGETSDDNLCAVSLTLHIVFESRIKTRVELFARDDAVVEVFQNFSGKGDGIII